MVRQYIGARYVTKIYENSLDPSSAEWESGVNYEPLTMVTYNNGSYLSKKDVPANVGNPAANPAFWVQTGFYNGQIASLQSQIDAINADIDAINDYLKVPTKNLVGNLILNHNFASTDGHAQGSCYVGNDKIVTYFAKSGTNTGLLRCYNMSTFAIEWEHSITAYHGNTITYNPNNNCIYITGNKDYNDVSVNSIIEISMAAPSVVLRTISMPSMISCASLVYDVENDVYYALASTGTTPGVDDILYIINSDLTTLVDVVTLEDYPTIKYFGTSIQGLSYAKNGIVYVIAYEDINRSIYTYEVSSGKLIATSDIPPIINECRAIGEAESLIFNYDNNAFIIGSELTFSGTEDYWVNMFFEIDLYKGVTVQKPIPSDYVFGYPKSTRFHALAVVPAGDTLKPSWTVATDLITVPNDALLFFKRKNESGYVRAIHSHHGVNAQSYTLYNLFLDCFNGRIAGNNASDPVAIKNCYCDSVIATFAFCDFTGDINPESTIHCNLYASKLHAYFDRCNFADITTGSPYHIWATENGNIYMSGCTFDGAATNYLASHGTSVTIA